MGVCLMGQDVCITEISIFPADFWHCFHIWVAFLSEITVFFIGFVVGQVPFFRAAHMVLWLKQCW